MNTFFVTTTEIPVIITGSAILTFSHSYLKIKCENLALKFTYRGSNPKDFFGCERRRQLCSFTWGYPADCNFFGTFERVPLLHFALRYFYSWTQHYKALASLWKGLPWSYFTWWQARNQASFPVNCAILYEQIPWYAKVCWHLHETDLWSKRLRWGADHRMARKEGQAWQNL